MDEDVEACEEPGEMLAPAETKEYGLRQRPLHLPAGRPITDHDQAYTAQVGSRAE